MLYGDEFTADQVVIAAGSRAVAPEAVTECGVPYHTSDTIMRIADVPDRDTIAAEDSGDDREDDCDDGDDAVLRS